MDHKNIVSRFSLTEFFAYFFPGFVGLTGLCVLFYNTRISDYLPSINNKFDLFIGIFALCIFAYIFGATFSDLPLRTIRLFSRKKRVCNNKTPRKFVDLPEKLAKQVYSAFEEVFGVENVEPDWDKSHFYLCRALVMEYMPRLGEFAQRQNNLRQFREYMILPIIIWLIVGIQITHLKYNGNLAIVISIAVALVLFTTGLITAIYSRSKANCAREVREILSAFLSGYNVGLFESQGLQIGEE